MGSGLAWEQYLKVKGYATTAYENVVHHDDGLNPGGGSCHWEPERGESSKVCTPLNGGHGTLPSPFNGYKEIGADPNKEMGIVVPEGYKGGFYPVPAPLPLGKGTGMPPGHDHAAMMKGQGMGRVVKRS
jgi:hypothetical protein